MVLDQGKIPRSKRKEEIQQTAMMKLVYIIVWHLGLLIQKQTQGE